MAVEAVIGVVTPTELGEWVESVAQEALHGRMRRVEELERVEIGSDLVDVAPPSAPKRPGIPTDRQSPRAIAAAGSQVTPEARCAHCRSSVRAGAGGRCAGEHRTVAGQDVDIPATAEVEACVVSIRTVTNVGLPSPKRRRSPSQPQRRSRMAHGSTFAIAEPGFYRCSAQAHVACEQPL